MSLVTDFAYQQKGMQLEIPETTNQEPDGTGEFYTLRNTHTYLSVSPMIKGFYSMNKFSGYVLIGPRIDYQLSMDAEFLPDLFEASEKLVLKIGNTCIPFM